MASRTLLFLIFGLSIALGETVHQRAPDLPTEQGPEVTIDAQKALDRVFEQYPDFAQTENFNHEHFAAIDELESVSGGFWPGTHKEPEDTTPPPNMTLATVRSRSLRARATPSELKAVVKCLQKAKVELASVWDDADDAIAKWVRYNNNYNKRVEEERPSIFALPRSRKDVSNAVKCSATGKLRMAIQARAGGHSYGAFSSGSEEGMVIDLRFMDKLAWRVNDKTGEKTAVAQAGFRLGEYPVVPNYIFDNADAMQGNLALQLHGAFDKDPRAISHGDCPSVGLAGHSLHGGFGYTSRMWGLSTDHIIGLDVVTDDGKERYIDANKDKDLFWAMKGAGDSFAIATRFHLKTREAPKRVVRYVYDLEKQWGKPSTMAKTFAAVTKCVQTDKNFRGNYGMTIRLAKDSYRVAGYFYGSRDDYLEYMDPCLSKATGVKVSTTRMTFPEALAAIGGRFPLQQPRDNTGQANFLAKSLLIPEDKPPSADSMKAYFEAYKKAMEAGWAHVFTFRLMGGRGSKATRPDDTSAISWRNTLWICQHDVPTDEYQYATVSFVNQMHTKLQEVTGGKRFYQFPAFLDPTHSRSEAHKVYFSAEDSSKLKRYKKKWDPNNIFRNPQSVRA